MLSRDQSQKASDGSTAIQAAGNVTVVQVGPSYEQIKEMALDIFRANFYEMAGQAKEIARARAEEITEEFLSKLQKESPENFKKADDPDFQYALFTVQREYARSGDKELGDLLVDLLCDRSKQQERNILQIVLNESLNTAPKLTAQQLAVLTVIFLFGYTRNLGSVSHDVLGAYLDKHRSLFSGKLVENQATFQHLEFAGCGTTGVVMRQLPDVFSNEYRTLFAKGFGAELIAEKSISIGQDIRFFIPCINDGTKIQVRQLSLADLEGEFRRFGIGEHDKQAITHLFHLNVMDASEVRSKVIEIRPYMEELFDVWARSSMVNFGLTSVGIAIAHANVKRLIGEFANLSIWIN
ncbi:hypothetical protein AWB69_05705 [Caballeronia udeis]|uniref:Uncharacterized protein n=1 Tax=Caballeronia udeis TaxID=1232866 RepID=A0A158IBH7_9BURK|nr:LPO_1073/Vpar_1526 family protein [Caballeronia udeis]SAL53928.1 hypothetical protein AWB69_05705 [Caballeronia udeis]